MLDAQPGIADAPVLASTFDALVAVPVETAKVLPHVFLPAADDVSIAHVLKATAEVADGLGMELVLMALEIAELSEALVAGVQLAGEWFGRRVDDLVCADIAPLCECLAADVTLIWPFARMSTLVGLEIA